MKLFNNKPQHYGKKRVLAVFYPTACREWNTISMLRQLQQQESIELHILFVAPRIPAQFYLVPETEQIAKQQWQEAERALVQIAGLLNVPTERQWISHGSVTAESCWLANHLDVDQIVGNSMLSKWHYLLRRLFAFTPNEPVGQTACRKHRLASVR